MEYSYLYEIIEDYKDSTSNDKDNIFNLFCSFIWNSDNERNIYNKSIRFYVKDNVINSDIGQLFNNWSNVEYKICKFTTKEDDWCSLIRQKINNLYTIYCDKEIILKKDYIDLLKTPKRLYYQWISGQNFLQEELTDKINNSMDVASCLYKEYQKQKLSLSWDEYMEVTNSFFKKIFKNCKTIDEYEKTNDTKISLYQDFMTEDNFYIKYFCNSLEFYMKNYQKEYYGLNRRRNVSYKRCVDCGKLIDIKNKKDFSTKYCDDCKRKNTLNKYKKYNEKRKRNK